MGIDRRQFLAVAGAAAATTTLPSFGSKGRLFASPVDLASVREHYPRAVQQVYLNCAAHCPLSTHTRAGMEKYMDFHRTFSLNNLARHQVALKAFKCTDYCTA